MQKFGTATLVETDFMGRRVYEVIYPYQRRKARRVERELRRKGIDFDVTAPVYDDLAPAPRAMEHIDVDAVAAMFEDMPSHISRIEDFLSHPENSWCTSPLNKRRNLGMHSKYPRYKQRQHGNRPARRCGDLPLESVHFDDPDQDPWEGYEPAPEEETAYA